MNCGKTRIGTVLTKVNGSWKEYAQAIGTVIVPNNTEIKLRWSPNVPFNSKTLEELDCDSLYGLDLLGIKITESDVKAISKLTALRELDLSWTGVNDRAVVCLSDLKLKVLKLAHTMITGRELFFPGLSELTLRGVTLDSVGFSQVMKHVDLEVLDVAATGINDELVTLLAGLSKLVSLDLSGNVLLTGRNFALFTDLIRLSVAWSEFDNDQLVGFKHLKCLQELDLSGSRITDGGLGSLVGLPLRKLILRSCPKITNMAASVLGLLVGLKALEVRNTGFDNRGIFALWGSIPGCAVNGLNQAQWRQGILDGSWVPGDEIASPI